MLHPCMLHRRIVCVLMLRQHVASVCFACCIGACCTLHVANAQPSRSARSCSPLYGVLRVRCSIGRRPGFAAAERRRDALVHSRMVACSPYTRAPRCSTPWRYPAPEQRCERGEAAMRSWGGCRRTGCGGRLQWAWLRRLVRSSEAAWCAWTMAPSRSRAARSRKPRRRCVRPARVARPRAVVWYVARCGTTDEWRARCGERCTAYGACGRSGACEYAFRIVAEGATPSGRGGLHSGARAACAARCACARHTPRGELSQRKDACIEAYHVPKPRSGPVPPRCMRYRMRRAVCDAHVAPARAACCIGARCIGAIHRLVCCINMSQRCVLHRCAFHVASVRICMLHVSSGRAAPVRVYVASVRVVCCIMHRRALACCIGVCCVLHRRVLHVACCKRAAVPQRTVSAVRCVVSAARALLDRAKVLHVVTRYALYSARCGARAACCSLRVRRVVCNTLYADGVERL
jgi:hypothetical protein